MSPSVLTNTFICAIFALILGIVLCIFTKSLMNIKWFQFINKKRITSKFALFFFGCVIGLSYTLIFYIGHVNNNEYIGVLSILIILLPATLYHSYWISAGSFVSVPIFALSVFHVDNLVLLLLGGSFALYLVISIFWGYIFKKSNLMIRIILLHLSFVILEVLILFICLQMIDFKYINHPDIWFTVSINLIFVNIAWIIYAYINKVYLKGQQIYSKNLYIYDHFISRRFRNIQIASWMNEVKPQYAQVFALSIKYSDFDIKNRNSNALAKIQEWAAKKVFNLFNVSENALFFMSNKNVLCVLVPSVFNDLKNSMHSLEGNDKLTRAIEDPLQKYENLTNIFNNSQNYHSSLKVDINLFIGNYGTSNNDMFSLISKIDKSISLFHPAPNSNFIQLHNDNYHSSDKEFTYEYHKVKNIFNQSDIKIKRDFIEVENEKILLPSFLSWKLLGFNGMQLLNSIPRNLHSMSIKYLSAIALQKYRYIINEKNHAILIAYPIESLINSNWTSQVLYSKLATMGINTKHVILKIDLSFLSSETDLLVANLLALKMMNIRFFFKNVNIDNIDLLEKIKPYRVLVNNEQLKKGKRHQLWMTRLLNKYKVKSLVI